MINLSLKALKSTGENIKIISRVEFTMNWSGIIWSCKKNIRKRSKRIKQIAMVIGTEQNYCRY